MSSVISEFKTLLFEEKEPRIGTELLNAINLDMLKDFEKLFHALSQDDSIRVLIITGAGRGYSSKIKSSSNLIDSI